MSTNSHSFFFFCVCVHLFIFLGGGVFFPPQGIGFAVLICPSRRCLWILFVREGKKTYLTYNQRSATFPYICTDITAETVKHGKIPKLSKLQ